ncbi:ankyrin repeat domain-containing protein 39-like [Ruditapes philippinarum]|uniref:ankyrin repeat domain-containing protein 39-like n=1 Tax=Ruditapes philippinarum TaxID=129788 RepID=UPI00295A5F79|nr:ankyrin repeat domain-containing protein 39-like [Ruditapes philippinarum]
MVIKMCEKEHKCECAHSSTNPSVQQTLEELDFSRGIWTAALDGSYEDVVKFLEKKNDPVDKCDASGYTALHYASRNGHTRICKLLLDNNASPNIQTRSGGVTPLHRAAYCGHTDIVELLLKHGADPLIADSDGKLPLHKAAEKGFAPVVEILVKAAKNSVFHKDNRGRTPTDCVTKDCSNVKSLLE